MIHILPLFADDVERQGFPFHGSQRLDDRVAKRLDQVGRRLRAKSGQDVAQTPGRQEWRSSKSGRQMVRKDKTGLFFGHFFA